VQQRSIVRLGVPLAVAALALTACGDRGGSTTTASGGGAATKVAKIGVIAPLTGDLSALGKGIQHSVELAVKQANDSNAIPGWKLEVLPLDDEAKADVGKNAATKAASDDAVIGVVGTLNSSVAQQTQPILNTAKIAQVSPANTNPTLTKGADAAAPEAPLRQLLPHLHHRRGPGSVRGPVPPRRGHQEGRDGPRQEGLRPGPGRRLHGRVQEGRRQIVTAQTINPDESNYTAVVSAIKPN
jgi:branched-chain amino acid transport system substrate-binding protein